MFVDTRREEGQLKQCLFSTHVSLQCTCMYPGFFNQCKGTVVDFVPRSLLYCLTWQRLDA